MTLCFWHEARDACQFEQTGTFISNKDRIVEFRTSPGSQSAIQLVAPIQQLDLKDPTMSTEPNRLERRLAQRFEVHLPVAIHFDGRTVPGFTQDLTGRGVFFYTEAALGAGAPVELTFTMPSEITLSENMPVRCAGRVVRAAHSQAGQQNGIAVQIDAHEYLPSDQLTSHFVRVSPPRPGTTSRPITR
jgi:hypothetical protein